MGTFAARRHFETVMIKLLGIAGSLRKDSIHKKLLETAKTLAPDGMVIETFDLSGVVPYNMDLEPNFPQRVVELKERIREADGVILAVPEHNYSFSGVMKNALDWVSRPLSECPLTNKPVILQSASTGMMGGSRAQYHLRQVLGYLECKQMQFPELFVPRAGDKFGEDGLLNDEASLTQMRKQLKAFMTFIEQGR